MTIINDIKIKDHYVYNLPKNEQLSFFAHKNRKTGNLAEVIFGCKYIRKCFMDWISIDRKLLGTISLIFM